MDTATQSYYAAIGTYLRHSHCGMYTATFTVGNGLPMLTLMLMLMLMRVLRAIQDSTWPT